MIPCLAMPNPATRWNLSSCRAPVTSAMDSKCAARCRTASARWSAPSSSSIIAGRSFGIASSVAMVSPWFYTEVSTEQGASVPLDPDHEERAIYLVDGEVEISGDRFEGPRLLIFRPGDRITVKATKPTRMMFLGGDALESPRHIGWNFVSSSKERIGQAKQDWKTGRFAPVPNEHEFIPLPE